MRKIAENAFYDGSRLILRGVGNSVGVLRKEGIELEDENLTIHVDSIEEALETYRRVVRALLHTEHLKKLGFSYREIFGYGFLVYLKEYAEGLENEILNHPLRRDFDIVTLPNREGFYYSTLYGIDNLNIPAILVLGNLFANELTEVVKNNPSLMELLELKRISSISLERFGDSKLSRVVRSLERIESIEEVIKKMFAVRFAFSCEIAVAGKVEHAEIQKVRKLGNGLCIYLNRNLRKLLNIGVGDKVAVKVLDGKILIEKIS